MEEEGAYRNKRSDAIHKHDTFLCVQMWPWTWWSRTCQGGGQRRVMCTRPGLLHILNILRRRSKHALRGWSHPAKRESAGFKGSFRPPREFKVKVDDAQRETNQIRNEKNKQNKIKNVVTRKLTCVQSRDTIRGWGAEGIPHVSQTDACRPPPRSN